MVHTVKQKTYRAEDILQYKLDSQSRRRAAIFKRQPEQKTLYHVQETSYVSSYFYPKYIGYRSRY
jgi:hypothetical protein